MTVVTKHHKKKIGTYRLEERLIEALRDISNESGRTFTDVINLVIAEGLKSVKVEGDS